ncbi:hypothetical protein PISMIDRAFT_98221 [Pisolithus microcarpus 441]|uniref:Uncharacterized protein n=1 Tax=Pisolithus microcarpus 441 TaxID=765257 RepID=A0A0C9Z662_9AGAM|nr:hypothetical protein PISMIDRAFT_98221 [Pisolithus microcarpus 441]
MIKRAGEIGEPCGMPLVTGFDGDSLPSRQIAASRCVRKDVTHLTNEMGRFFWHSILASLVWLMKSK